MLAAASVAVASASDALGTSIVCAGVSRLVIFFAASAVWASAGLLALQ